MEQRNKYERFFSNWLFENLPNSDTWMLIMDIDFVLSNYKTKKFCFIELKTRWNEVTYSQKQMYNIIHKRLLRTNWKDWWKYEWTHLIRFEKDNFDDWYCELNWKFIKEYELIFKIEELLWIK